MQHVLAGHTHMSANNILALPGVSAYIRFYDPLFCLGDPCSEPILVVAAMRPHRAPSPQAACIQRRGLRHAHTEKKREVWAMGGS